MPITIHSPHSGQPVKIRDQDVGRAVRDEEGRIFYVVERDDGSGYYAAPTRKGSQRDEQRYDQMIRTEARGQAAAANQQQSDKQAIHDATGKRRVGPAIRLAAILIILIVLALLAYVVFFDGQIPYVGGLDRPSPAPDRHDAKPRSEQSGAMRTDASGQVFYVSRSTTLIDEFESSFTHDKFIPSTTPAGQAKPQTLGSYLGSVPTAAEAKVSAQARQLMASSHRKPMASPAHARQGDHPSLAMQDEQPIPNRAVGSFAAVDSHRHNPTPRPNSTHNSHRPMIGYQWLCGLALVNARAPWSTRTLDVGRGPPAQNGDTLSVQYQAYVNDADRPFQQTGKGDPLTVVLGRGEVIPGLEMALVGMRQGETRIVHIPPYFAYGQRGVGALVPPGASLTYRLTLVNIEK